ncbi:MAG: translocation/assembly module TamB domain-containing protein [Myxococcales bacterium]|nr:translocation/assembly module TamB domain-containing protein [Myxococcales bacterium]
MGAPRPGGGLLTGRGRRLVTALLATLLLVLGGLGITALWLRSDAGQRRVARLVAEQLGGQLTAGRVEIARVQLTLSGVRLRGLRLEGPEGTEVVTVPQASATLGPVGWTGLLRGQIWLGEVQVDAPRVAWAESADWPTVASDPEAPTTWMPPGWTLQIDRALVRQLEIAGPGVDVQGGTVAAAVTADTSMLQVSGLVASASLGHDDGACSGSGAATLRGEDLDTVSLQLHCTEGRATVQGRIPQLVGEAPELALEGTATASTAWLTSLGLPWEGPGWQLQGQLVGPLPMPHLTVSGFLHASPPTTADLVAEITPTSPELEAVRLDVRVPDVAVLEPLGVPLQAGTLEVAGTLERTAEPGELHAALTATGSDWLARGGVGLATAALPLVVERHGEGLEVRTSRARVSGLTVGRVAVGALSGGFDLSLQGDALTVTTAWTESGGERRVALSGQLDLANRTAVARQLEIELGPDLTWRQTTPTELAWSDTGLRALRADLGSPSGRIRVDAAGTEPLSVHAQVEDLDLATTLAVAGPFLPPSMPAIEGRLTASVTPVGTRRAPQWRWQIRARDLSVQDVATQVDVLGAGTLDGASWSGSLDVGRVGRALGRLEATLPLRRAGPTDFALACGTPTAEVALSMVRGPVAGLQSALPSLAELEVPEGAELQAQLDASGDPCDPTWSLTALGTATVEERRLQARLAADGEPDNLALGRLSLRVDDAEHATGQVAVSLAPLVEGLDAQGIDDVVHHFFGDLRVKQMPTLWGETGIEGAISGQTSFQGRGTVLASTTGTLDWTAPVDAFRGPVQASWSTAGDVLQTSVDLDAGDDEPAAVRLRLGLSDLQQRGRNARLAGDIAPLTLTGAQLVALSSGTLTDGVGVVTAQGTLGGTLSAPTPQIAVAVRDVGFTVPSTGVRYESLQLSAEADGQGLTITDGRGTSRPLRRSRVMGSRTPRPLAVSGSVAFRDGSVQPDLKIELDESWLLATRDATVKASGSVALRRVDERLQLSGAVAIDEGRYAATRETFVTAGAAQLHPDITFVGAAPPALAQPDDLLEASILDQVDLDLTVDLGTGVELSATVPLADQADLVSRASDVEVTGSLQGTVQVDSKAADLKLRGRLDTQGRVRLLTARFEVEEGTVTFNGGDLSDPDVDLRLRRETPSYGTVTARVMGTPTRLTVSDLSSDDFDDPQDVIAILLVGRPLSELEGGTTGSGSELVQSALLSVAGNQVQQVLGAEVFDQVSYTDTEGLTVGWALGTQSTLTVTLDPLADDANTAQAELTVLLSRHVEAGVRSGITGSGSAWILWRTRF